MAGKSILFHIDNNPFYDPHNPTFGPAVSTLISPGGSYDYTWGVIAQSNNWTGGTQAEGPFLSADATQVSVSINLGTVGNPTPVENPFEQDILEILMDGTVVASATQKAEPTLKNTHLSWSGAAIPGALISIRARVISSFPTSMRVGNDYYMERGYFGPQYLSVSEFSNTTVPVCDELYVAAFINDGSGDTCVASELIGIEVGCEPHDSTGTVGWIDSFEDEDNNVTVIYVIPEDVGITCDELPTVSIEDFVVRHRNSITHLPCTPETFEPTLFGQIKSYTSSTNTLSHTYPCIGVPYSLSFDTSHNFYVTEYNGITFKPFIEKFVNGNSVGVWGPNLDGLLDGSYFAIKIVNDGTVYLLGYDPDSRLKVFKISSTGTLINSWFVEHDGGSGTAIYLDVDISGRAYYTEYIALEDGKSYLHCFDTANGVQLSPPLTFNQIPLRDDGFAGSTVGGFRLLPSTDKTIIIARTLANPSGALDDVISELSFFDNAANYLGGIRTQNGLANFLALGETTSTYWANDPSNNILNKYNLVGSTATIDTIDQHNDIVSCTSDPATGIIVGFQGIAHYLENASLKWMVTEF